MPSKSAEEVFKPYEKDELHQAYYRIAQLEDALGFYANKENYKIRYQKFYTGIKAKIMPQPLPCFVLEDHGKLAKKALKQKTNETQ